MEHRVQKDKKEERERKEHKKKRSRRETVATDGMIAEPIYRENARTEIQQFNEKRMGGKVKVMCFFLEW